MMTNPPNNADWQSPVEKYLRQNQDSQLAGLFGRREAEIPGDSETEEKQDNFLESERVGIDKIRARIEENAKTRETVAQIVDEDDIVDVEVHFDD